VGLEEALTELRGSARFMRNVTAWERFPARAARCVDVPPQLDPWFTDRLRERGITQLYRHQGEALEMAWRGRNVVVVTPTSSGKTLCYNLPVLNALRTDLTATALYLFPTKALAQDQLTELRELIGPDAPALRADVYDGDTPKSARKDVRLAARLLVTNPDMLHTGILPHHTRWHKFLASLRYIVVDELHVYRGIFGSHLANVLRRLKRVCGFYGASPQFICSSATVANPLELAERLIEEELVLIDENGAPGGDRHFVLYNPPAVDTALGIRRSAALEARDLAARFLRHGVQTIVFARSRLGTELLLTYLRDAAVELGLPADAVRGYRGGYLPSERRDIERDLRAGRVRAVVATNALELGIDIGHLGACVMSGYPGTIASAWQQAGRAGRTSAAAAAVLVASASPLDQYIVTHPRYFFGRSPEHGLINPDNLNIVTSHIQCAAFELPFAEGECFGRFEQTVGVLSFLQDEHVVHQSGQSWHWMSESYPAQGVSLRTSDPNNFVIQSAGRDGVEVIGQVDAASAPMLIHEGAIYLHEGQQYEVTRLDWEGRLAQVKPVQVDYYTEATQSADIRVLDTFEQSAGGGLVKARGEVMVISAPAGYKKVKLYTHETLGYGQILLPEQEIHTTAYWLTFDADMVDALRAAGVWTAAAAFTRGPNWTSQRELARRRDGARCRHCGAPEREGQQHDVHHIRPFATFGYIPGENDYYLAANELGNLVTLCSKCHHLAEAGQAMRTVLAALAELIRHVAPIFLMCDGRDLGVVSEAKSMFTALPTIYAYDRIPAGVGLSDRLYELQGEVLAAAAELVRDCACESGCPSCVGPITAIDEDVKVRTQSLLRVIRAEVA
jgi:DEAD/DEAH box helicase domain-containing protein